MTVDSGTDAAALGRALRESEARYRALVEHAPEAIVVFDVNRGHFVDVNGEAELLFGASRAQLLERGPADLSPPVQPDGRTSESAAQAWIGRAVAGETPTFEWVHRRFDGSDVLCEVRLLRLPSDDAMLVRGSVTDIRARRAAEQRVQQLVAERAALAARAAVADELVAVVHRHEAMMAALQDGWFVTAADGRIVDVNVELCRIVGFRREDLTGATPPYPWWPPSASEREAWERATEVVDSTGRGQFDELTVQRADGARRTVMLSMAAFADGAGGGGRVATMKDVTERARAQDEREELLATLAAERDRVLRVQSTTAALARASTRDDVTNGVLAHGMRAFGARAAVVMLVDDAHRTLELVGLFGYRRGMFADLQRIGLDSASPLAAAVRSRRRREFRDLSEWIQHRPELEVIVREVGRAGACVPMLLHDRAIGVVGVAFADADALSPETLADLENLARLAAQAYDRVRLSELDREIAHVLQHSLLLDTLPATADGELAARYVSGVAEMEVGGDWYDVIDLDDGRLGLAVGDVVGRGARAATTMGQLRSALRALALVHDDPAIVLANLDRFARRTAGAAMATVVYAIYDPATATVRYACAGHPPPLVASRGETRFLGAGRSIPIGAGLEGQREAGVTSVDAGDLVVLYTDGLIERRGEPIDLGMERLAEAVRAHTEVEVGELGDTLLSELIGDRSPDDVALLVLRCMARPGAPFARRFPSEPATLGVVRRDLHRWIDRAGVRAADASEILLAVGEACANVIEHAYVDPPRRGDVELLARCEAGDVLVEVRDQGRWRPPIDDDRRGRGDRLMRALMDDVDVTSDGSGTVVTMRRRGVAAAPTSGRGRRASRRP